MAEQYRTETDCTELMGELSGSVETLSDNLDTLSGTVSDLSDHVDDVESACEESTQTLSTELTRLFNEIQSLISIGSGIPEIEEEIEVSGMTQYPTDKTLSIVDMAADAKAVGDEFANFSADMATALSRITAVENKTGSSIPVSDATGADSIAAAFAGMEAALDSVFANLYPVGSVYISAAETLPTVIIDIGTWVEVAVPLTWGDIRTGSRSYVEPETGFTAGNLHFWLRTE